jgi:serine-type D-Ala-D-Ala carboxypeptidase (penicillin-binding protein 5/6)
MVCLVSIGGSLGLRMLRYRFIVFFALALAVSAGISPAVVTASPSTLYDGPPASHYAPALDARAAITVDLTSGLQLYNHNGDMRVPPASTMKIVTALVVLEILDPSEMVTITAPDLVMGEEYSQMGLEAGDITTVEALLYGTMLSSGADSALALARVAGQRLDPSTSDPVGRFVAEMNVFATENRMFGSNFTNPVGIDGDNHYVTARDLVRAAKLMLDHRVLSRISSSPEIVVRVGGPNAREMYLFSTNQLILSGDSIGGKTGTTESAGQCLVNVVQRGGHTIVTVVMGSEDRYADTERLMEDVGQRFRFVILGAGASVLAVNDELAAMGLEFPVGQTILMTPAQAESLRYELELTGNRTPNGKAGTVVFRVGEQEILRLPVHSAF